jgi:hypothetical protein
MSKNQQEISFFDLSTSGFCGASYAYLAFKFLLKEKGQEAPPV